ncbi:MAG: NUDIX hydrolase [Candidatus Eremiobacteraeota bacterium]|nr:NUDIX hydrolase [Candidatus Eremiobacteraeota bacterium]
MQRIHLCTGVLKCRESILLVASRYKNHPEPLWNLPGGRQEAGELLPQTLQREFLEETGLSIEVGALLYVSESYDGTQQFTNTTFSVTALGEPKASSGDAHVVAVEWVAISDVASRVSAKVVREPLESHLSGSQRRYFGYADAEISIVFAD